MDSIFIPCLYHLWFIPQKKYLLDYWRKWKIIGVFVSQESFSVSTSKSCLIQCVVSFTVKQYC